MTEVAVIEIDRAGRVCTWSGQHGAADDHPEGHLLKEVWPEDPDVALDLARALQGEERHCTWRLEGEESMIFCLPSEGGALIVVHFAGPTILERRQQAFIEAVNHELRTPLAIISGFAELLRARSETASGAQRRAWSESMVTAAARLRVLIDNLLSVLQDKDPSSPAEAVEIVALVARAIATMAASRPDCAIGWAGDPELRLYADADSAHAILCRLLENAADAAPVACISWGVERDMLAIHVHDKGSGIGSIGRAVLFTPFGTEPDHGGPGGRVGLGLGLYLARRAVRTLNGDLELENSGSDGTTFLLTLPLAAPADEQAGAIHLR